MPLMYITLGAVLELYLDGRMIYIKIVAKQRFDIFNYGATLTNIYSIDHYVTTQCIVARADSPNMQVIDELNMLKCLDG
jgi:hypothetical protein